MFANNSEVARGHFNPAHPKIDGGTTAMVTALVYCGARVTRPDWPRDDDDICLNCWYGRARYAEEKRDE
jgi:hypothetical protein